MQVNAASSGCLETALPYLYCSDGGTAARAVHEGCSRLLDEVIDACISGLAHAAFSAETT